MLAMSAGMLENSMRGETESPRQVWRESIAVPVTHGVVIENPTSGADVVGMAIDCVWSGLAGRIVRPSPEHPATRSIAARIQHRARDTPSDYDTESLHGVEVDEVRWFERKVRSVAQ
jgi:hypothetical protein